MTWIIRVAIVVGVVESYLLFRSAWRDLRQRDQA